MNLKTRNPVRDLVSAAMCLALCMVLPFLTGQIPEIGGMLCPMHIPVLLAGFICGPWYALAVGFLAPPLRFVMFGMPRLMPTGLAMAFELATYGLIVGILYRKLAKNVINTYVSMIAAMLLGRVVWHCDDDPDGCHRRQLRLDRVHLRRGSQCHPRYHRAACADPAAGICAEKGQSHRITASHDNEPAWQHILPCRFWI